MCGPVRSREWASKSFTATRTPLGRLIKDKEAHRKFSVRDDAAIEDTAADLAVVSAAACGGIGAAAAMS